MGSAAAAETKEPPFNTMPALPVTSKVPLQVLATVLLTFPSMPGQKPAPPTDSWALPLVEMDPLPLGTNRTERPATLPTVMTYSERLPDISIGPKNAAPLVIQI